MQAGLDDRVGEVKILVAAADVTDREQVTSLLVVRTEGVQLRLSCGLRCPITVWLSRPRDHRDQYGAADGSRR